jgi:SOS-response transcriptional repressor LexA
MNTQNKTVRIPIVYPVCAGSSIPDDWQNWQISSFRDIRAIGGLAKNERFVGIPVNGDSLEKIGIYHGDILITKITSEYKAGKLCVWQTPHGRTAKFARENFDGTVTLHNKNGWKQKWQSYEIQLVGIVVRIERDLD